MLILIKVNNYQAIRKAPTTEQIDQQFKQASKAIEGKFLEEMVKQMRSTVPESGGFIPTSSAEKIFREQLDQNYVEKWTEKGGLGLSDMIYQQLIDKYGSQMGLKIPVQKPQGPLPLKNQKAENPLQPGVSWQKTPGKSLEGYERNQIVFNLQKSAVASNDVVAPWDGKIRRLEKIDGENCILEIEHDQGAVSQILFKGKPDSQKLESFISGKDQVFSGEKVAQLDLTAKNLFWNINTKI